MKRILVVDDDMVTRKTASYILSKEGYIVDTVETGQRCLATLANEYYDLLLLDIDMPVMDGFETLRYIRNNPSTKNLAVVFLTGDNTVDSVIKASSLNASGYIVKPFIPENLISKVRDILEG